MEYKKNWIKEGIEVAHKDNPSLKMIVAEILRQTKTIRYQEEDGTMAERQKSFIIGIRCHYWEKDEQGNMVSFKKAIEPYVVPIHESEAQSYDQLRIQKTHKETVTG